MKYMEYKQQNFKAIHKDIIRSQASIKKDSIYANLDTLEK